MLSIPLYTGELLLALIWIIVRLILAIHRQSFDPQRELLMLLMLINLAFIIRFLFFPLIAVDGELPPFEFDITNLPPITFDFSPLMGVAEAATTTDLQSVEISKMALFIPTGIILPILYPQLNNLFRVALAGANFSLLIAMIQLPLGLDCDVFTIIQNTLGVSLGYGLYALAHSRHK